MEPRKPGGQLRFDAKMKKAFLRMYEATGRISESAHNLGFTHNTIGAHRKEDEEFDAAVRAAYARFQDLLEKEAYDRAVEGWKEPVYFQGKVVGHVLKKSDNILQSMLKRHIPAYKEKIQADVNITGGVLVVPGVAKTGEEWEQQFRDDAPKEGDDSGNDSGDAPV